MMLASPTPTLPAPAVGARRLHVPPFACDTHSHVFGPFSRFPPHLPSVYALPDADRAAHKAMRDALGMARGVLIQPAPYGDDPAAMLDAIAASGGGLKGIAVASADIAPDVLAQWAGSGIAGLRFSEARAPGGERYPGSVGFAALPALAPIMRELGLHAQLWAPMPVLTESMPALLKLGVPLVIDHMAMLNPADEQTPTLLDNLIPLLANEDIWLKLVLCRVDRADLTGGAAVRKFHNTLLDACPKRMLWGSDWPYVRLDPAPDAAVMLDIFADWAGDYELVRKVLVDNPAQLFKF